MIRRRVCCFLLCNQDADAAKWKIRRLRKSNESRRTIINDARDNGITLVDSLDLRAETRRLSAIHGVTTHFYTGGDSEITGFVVGRDIFIDSRRLEIPTA